MKKISAWFSLFVLVITFQSEVNANDSVPTVCTATASLHLSNFYVQSFCTNDVQGYNCTSSRCYYPSRVQTYSAGYDFVFTEINDFYYRNGFELTEETIISRFTRSGTPAKFRLRFIKR